MDTLPTPDEWLSESATNTLDFKQMDGLIKDNQHLWEKYDTARKIASECLADAEASDRKILEALKSAGKSKYYVDGLGTIAITQKSMVRVPSSIEAKKEFFKHLRTIGEEFLFSMATVNSNSLNSWYNKCAEEAYAKGDLGFSVPGIEGATMRESLRFTKERKK
jgi:hypothetical protein